LIQKTPEIRETPKPMSAEPVALSSRFPSVHRQTIRGESLPGDGFTIVPAG
jgi:hypothetical protein